MELGGPVWHASARAANESVAWAMAERALRAVGGAALGEWRERGHNGTVQTFPDPRPRTRRGQRLGRTPKWCSGRCRKRTLYAGRCVDCGAPTDGSNGRDMAPERCNPCTREFLKWWTRERIVEAIRLFADRYGTPPGVVDFAPGQARALGAFDRVERFERDNDYPHVSTVTSAFGTWNEAIEAAGFPAVSATSSGPNSTPDAEYIETVQLYERHGTTETARRLGLTPNGVRYRVRYARAHGLTDTIKKAPRSGNSRRRDP